MRLYDCEQSAQKDIINSGNDEEYESPERNSESKTNKFSGFKF